MKKLLGRIAVVLGILLALAGLRILAGRLLGPSILERARARFEAEVGPLRPELAGATVAPADNAGALLIEAVEALRFPSEDRTLVRDLGRRDADPADPAVRERLHAILDRNAASLELIDRASARTDSLMQARRDYFLGTRNPAPVIRLVDLAQLVRAAGLVALAEDDDPALLAAIRRLATIARAGRLERVVVAQIPARIAENDLHDLLRLRLARAVPSADLAELERSLSLVESAPDLREILIVECGLGDLMLREVASEPDSGSFGEGWLSPWDDDHFRAETFLAYAEVAALVDRPRDQWREPSQSTRTRVLAALVDPFSTPTIVRGMMASTLRSFVESEQRNRAEHALARAALRFASGDPPPVEQTVAYTGEAIRTRTLGDGTLELALPEAAARILAEATSYADARCDPRRNLELQAERMTWRVAPPPEIPVVADRAGV
ncbi:MAG TPA: hypothetical protein VLA66_00860 [Thermoanaerobaculia bacterium]|nr:hypothetical protein [Thermoanaerobaculia bacterium]